MVFKPSKKIIKQMAKNMKLPVRVIELLAIDFRNSYSVKLENQRKMQKYVDFLFDVFVSGNINALANYSEFGKLNRQLINDEIRMEDLK